MTSQVTHTKHSEVEKVVIYQDKLQTLFTPGFEGERVFKAAMVTVKNVIKFVLDF
jgi:hypothetical protein